MIFGEVLCGFLRVYYGMLIFIKAFSYLFQPVNVLSRDITIFQLLHIFRNRTQNVRIQGVNVFVRKILDTIR